MFEETTRETKPHKRSLLLSPWFWVRTALFGVLAYLFFGLICIPVKTNGSGMEPTYRPGRITFCWRPAYWFSEPAYYDVVFVRIPGARGFLLRRVIGMPNDVVAFDDGQLVVNGTTIDEPYVRRDCDWTMPPGRIKADSVFVVGDNRALPMDDAMFGRVRVSEIAGAPLW